MIVDAILGTGLTQPVRGEAAEASGPSTAPGAAGVCHRHPLGAVGGQRHAAGGGGAGRFDGHIRGPGRPACSLARVPSAPAGSSSMTWRCRCRTFPSSPHACSASQKRAWWRRCRGVRGRPTRVISAACSSSAAASGCRARRDCAGKRVAGRGGPGHRGNRAGEPGGDRRRPAGADLPAAGTPRLSGRSARARRRRGNRAGAGPQRLVPNWCGSRWRVTSRRRGRGCAQHRR